MVSWTDAMRLSSWSANSLNDTAVISCAASSWAFRAGAKYWLHSKMCVSYDVGQCWYVWYQPRSHSWMPKLGQISNSATPTRSWPPGRMPAICVAS